jgi:CubicO group peptidase (beta-lactamase class C family)
MILFEEGKWQLDDPVAKFVPEFAGLKVRTANGLVDLDHPPTMRELVTSTAGWPGGFPLNSSFPDLDETYAKAVLHDGTLNDMAAKLAKLPLESQPGAKFRYGIQHDIQGLVVERISGKTFDRFLQDRLFGPLGMVDTGFHIPEAKLGRLATLYAYDKAMKLTPTPFQGAMPASNVLNPTFFSGTGGLYSTALDYERLLRMLANGGELDGARILAPSTVRLMMSDMLPEGVKLKFAQQIEGVGYGVDLGVVLDPPRASFNSGAIGKGSTFWTGAHGTWFWIDPQHDVIVLGMTQLAFSAALHMGMPYPAPDLRAMSRSLVYQALVDESR